MGASVYELRQRDNSTEGKSVAPMIEYKPRRYSFIFFYTAIDAQGNQRIGRFGHTSQFDYLNTYDDDLGELEALEDRYAIEMGYNAVIVTNIVRREPPCR